MEFQLKGGAMRKTIGFIFQLFLAVVLVLSLIPASIEAVPVSVDFQGTLQPSGQTFSGSFTYDTDTLPAFVLPNTFSLYPNAGTLSVSVGSSTWTGANAFVALLNDLDDAADDTFSIFSSNVSGPSTPAMLSLLFSGPSTLSNVLSLPSVFPTDFNSSLFSNGLVSGSISSVSVPEPSSFMLMGVGIIVAALTVRKIKRK